MKGTMIRLRTRPYFLLGYFTAQFLFFCVMIAMQCRYTEALARLQIPPTWWGLVPLPLLLIGGLKVPVLMHNAVHGNLRPRWLNRVAGEAAGVYLMLGMEAFALNHAMHHAYADTGLDPHRPAGQKFYRFLFTNSFGGTGPVRCKYLEFHGDTSLNRAVFRLVVVMHFLNLPARAVFWLLLLGPSYFVTMFLPSYLFQMAVFAHINFATHATLPDGRTEVRNLDSNLYYRFVNYFGHGVYYHKNHHLRPGQVDPRSTKRPRSPAVTPPLVMSARSTSNA